MLSVTNYPLILIIIMHAECHYAECHYAECHYAKFHYAECHGAKFLDISVQKVVTLFTKHLTNFNDQYLNVVSY